MEKSREQLHGYSLGRNKGLEAENFMPGSRGREERRSTACRNSQQTNAIEKITQNKIARKKRQARRHNLRRLHRGTAAEHVPGSRTGANRKTENKEREGQPFQEGPN